MIDPAEKSDIARLELLLTAMSERLQAMEAPGELAAEWYTLRQAARLKRGTEIRRSRKTGEIQTFESFYRTLCARPRLQPHGGVPEAHVGGVAVWHRDTVRMWLRLTDEELEAVRKAG